MNWPEFIGLILMIFAVGLAILFRGRDRNESRTLGEKMGTGAPALLLQKIENILGRCVCDQPDTLTYDEGVAMVRALPELSTPSRVSEEQRVKPLMEAEIVRLADKYMDLRDEGADSEAIEEALSLLDGRLTQLRLITSAILVAPPAEPFDVRESRIANETPKVGDSVLIPAKVVKVYADQMQVGVHRLADDKCAYYCVVDKRDVFTEPPER